MSFATSWAFGSSFLTLTGGWIGPPRQGPALVSLPRCLLRHQLAKAKPIKESLVSARWPASQLGREVGPESLPLRPGPPREAPSVIRPLQDGWPSGDKGASFDAPPPLSPGESVKSHPPPETHRLRFSHRGGGRRFGVECRKPPPPRLSKAAPVDLN